MQIASICFIICLLVFTAGSYYNTFQESVTPPPGVVTSPHPILAETTTGIRNLRRGTGMSMMCKCKRLTPKFYWL